MQKKAFLSLRGTKNDLYLIQNTPTALPATEIGITSFIANWNPVRNAQRYFIDISLDLGFTSLVFSSQEVNDTYFVVPGLTALTTYYYRVRANSVRNTSANSNVISVATLV